MAYLNVPDGRADAAPGFASRARAVFERTEWEVIVLAQRDDLASLRKPGRFSRTLAKLFGCNPDRRLASPRLETLRGMAVLAWHHGHAVPLSAMKAFRHAGFSPAQLELLLASVSRGRSSLRASA